MSGHPVINFLNGVASRLAEGASPKLDVADLSGKEQTLARAVDRRFGDGDSLISTREMLSFRAAIGSEDVYSRDQQAFDSLWKLGEQLDDRIQANGETGDRASRGFLSHLRVRLFSRRDPEVEQELRRLLREP